jgi:hypothetical protein
MTLRYIDTVLNSLDDPRFNQEDQMSVEAVAVVLSFALNLAIGGDTEEAMQHDVWRQAGRCDRQCHWGDASPECRRQEARNLPCDVNHVRAQFWDNYLHEPERPWQDSAPSALYEKELRIPEWVPSVEPTAHRIGNQWLKMRL